MQHNSKSQASIPLGGTWSRRKDTAIQCQGTDGIQLSQDSLTPGFFSNMGTGPLDQMKVDHTLNSEGNNFQNPVVYESGFGGLEVSVLAFGTQVRGFKPGRNRRIFRAKKSSARLPSEGK